MTESPASAGPRSLCLSSAVHCWAAPLLCAAEQVHCQTGSGPAPSFIEATSMLHGSAWCMSCQAPLHLVQGVMGGPPSGLPPHGMPGSGPSVSAGGTNMGRPVCRWGSCLAMQPKSAAKHT